MKACPICENPHTRFERVLNKTELLKCSQCGFVFADLVDQFAAQKNASFSERSTALCEEQQGILDLVWFQRIATHFTQLLGTGLVLDVGCGNGRLLSHFQKLGWECYGSDPSPWALPAAEKYGFTYIPGRIEDLVPGRKRFDLAVSTSTLEHISRPLAHVRFILTLLCPGGLAYFAGVPNYGSLSVKLGLSTFRYNTPPLHVNYFTRRSMRALFERAVSPGQRATVHTYGIPELHAGWGWLKNILKRRSAPDEPGASDFQSLVSYPKQDWLPRFLIALNYYPGRLLGLGDKLEVLVRG
jgi:SAM-dependent methyltransferase